jgi:hypothetical protein
VEQINREHNRNPDTIGNPDVGYVADKIINREQEIDYSVFFHIRMSRVITPDYNLVEQVAYSAEHKAAFKYQ